MAGSRDAWICIGPELSGQWLHLLAVCGRSLLSFKFRDAWLRPHPKSIQCGDDWTAHALHVPSLRWLSIGGPDQSADFGWRDKANRLSDSELHPWGGKSGQIGRAHV